MIGRLALIISAVLLVSACQGSKGNDGPKPSLPPELAITPPPGTYDAAYVDVVVTAPSPVYKLYFAVNTAVTKRPSNAYSGEFTVRLIGSSRISVAVEDPEGRWWEFGDLEYRLVFGFPSPGCRMGALPRPYFKHTESIPVSFDFIRDNALAEVDLLLDGRPVFRVETDPGMRIGTTTTVLKPVQAEGWHKLECSVSSPGQTAVSEEVLFLIDRTPPSVSWLGQAGLISAADWDGVFPIAAADAGSGLDVVEVCRDDLSFCLPVGTSGNGTYRYATAITRGTDTSGLLRLRATDRVGWSATSAAVALELRGYGAPSSTNAQTITATTAPSLDLAVVTGKIVDEFYRVDAQTLQSEQSSAVTVFPGWNAWTYRPSGAVDWSTFAIYGSGVTVSLPASSSAWLVYATQSTLPAFEASPLARLAPNTQAWEYAALQVPHLFFVADEIDDGRWSAEDAVYRCAEDSLPDGLWMAEDKPVACTLEPAPQVAMTGPTQQVEVDCDECSAQGTLWLEYRSSVSAWPEMHAMVSAVTFPSMVSVHTMTEHTCVWWWDDDDEGIIETGDPRAIEPCSSSVVRLSTYAPGPLRFTPNPNAIIVDGLQYGGTLTAEAAFLDQSNEIVTTAWETVVDSDGDGSVNLPVPEYIRKTEATLALRLYSGSRELNHTEAFTLLPTPRNVTVHVRDSAGDPAAAVVWVVGDRTYVAVADSTGTVSVSLPDNAFEIWARRDGFLSMPVPISGATEYVLKITGAEVTGEISGRVTSETATPISGATVSWNADSGFRSHTRTNSQGEYALPASGGEGILHVELRHREWPVQRDYAFAVTTNALTFDMVLPDPHGPRTSMGMSLLAAPEYRSGSSQVLDNTTHFTVAGSLPDGKHTLGLGMLNHEVTLPGLLPTLHFPSTPYLVPYYGGSQLEDRMLRCGDRYQIEHGGVTLDAPCWTWTARDGLENYFLGIYGGQRAFPETVGITTVFLAISGYSGTAVVLRDRLLNRQIRLPAANGMADGGVPYGVYEIYSQDGVRLNRNGAPATLRVPIESSAVLTVP